MLAMDREVHQAERNAEDATRAVMRNVEFSTQVDVVFKKTNTPMYVGFNMIRNKHGENLTQKYIQRDVCEGTCRVPAPA